MFIQITNLSPIIAFYHALVGAAAMLTCVATYMDHFPHIADDPVIFLTLKGWGSTNCKIKFSTFFKL